MMNLLLDTHVLLWLAVDDPRLGRHVTDAVIDPGNAIHVSVVSRWEILLKQGRPAGFSLPEPFERMVDRAGFQPLGLDFDVPARLVDLPPLHADPFDRMLIAQALHHDCILVTADETIRGYPVKTLW